jgi:hypothetical protein
VGKVEGNHAQEGRLAGEKEEARQAEAAEWRKFRWGILAAVVMAGLDLVLRIIHLK